MFAINYECRHETKCSELVRENITESSGLGISEGKKMKLHRFVVK